MERRSFLTNTGYAVAGGALSACGTLSAAPTSKRPIILVHGAWHGAWCWEKVTPLLVRAGHPVVARDLPGHGLNARLPNSFDEFPRTAAFSSEPSPVAAITLADYADHVIQSVDALLANGSGPPVLVGHSMGGLAIQAAAEALGPAKVHRLVYLAAFMPAHNASMTSYTTGSTQSDSKLQPLFRANPGRIGAIRIDPRAADPAYIAALSGAFYADVAPEVVAMTRHYLTPDIPLRPLTTPIGISAASWGAIPRTYIRTAMDATVRPASQDLMVAQADAFSPANRTRVVRMETSHSPFFSQPLVLADVLIAQSEA